MGPMFVSLPQDRALGPFPHVGGCQPEWGHWGWGMARLGQNLWGPLRQEGDRANKSLCGSTLYSYPCSKCLQEGMAEFTCRTEVAEAMVSSPLLSHHGITLGGVGRARSKAAPPSSRAQDSPPTKESRGHPGVALSRPLSGRSTRASLEGLGYHGNSAQQPSWDLCMTR